MSNREGMKCVAVLGSDQDSCSNTSVFDAARESGVLLAERGYTIMVGGGRGVMAAVVEGANHAGGMTVAYAALDEDKSGARLVAARDLGWGNHSIMMLNAADGLLFMSGGAGTLMEFAYGYLLNKPMVALTGYGGWSDTFHQMGMEHLDARKVRRIVYVPTPAEAVEALASMMDGHST